MGRALHFESLSEDKIGAIKSNEKNMAQTREQYGIIILSNDLKY